MAAKLAKTGEERGKGAFVPAGRRGEHYAGLPDDSDHGIVNAHAVQTIMAEPEALFDLWSEVKLYPLWQEHVISVERTRTEADGNVTHWVMGDPSEPHGKRIEFDSKTVEDRANMKISWRSITNSLQQSGYVTFVATESGRGTLVTLIQRINVPGGTVGNAVVATAKRSPRQTVIEDLRHFKQLAETGEIPSVEGQPHGPRGISGGIKRWMYGETIPTPPGSSKAA